MIVVLNAATLAISEYDLTAVDVAAYEGAVYRLSGAALQAFAEPVQSDEGAVESYIETGELAIAPGRRINLRLARAVLSSDEPMALVTKPKMEGTAVEHSYEVPELSSDETRARRIQFGRGPRAERWALRLTTTAAGGAWALDHLGVLYGWADAPGL